MQQTYATLFSLTNKLQITGDRYFEGITSRQFMVMMAIIHLPEEETTINNIARKLGTTKQSLKQLILLIEKKGYVVTVPSKRDKRAVNVKITSLGKQVMLKAADRGMKFFQTLFKDFSTGLILWSGKEKFLVYLVRTEQEKARRLTYWLLY
ncbi:MarR family winged helix-turn-helix transcriptional regulator [Paenibacillus dendritiformis]|uniref:MarR family winged helix-turn-helix transcriptional regulator n=1 Tax=Paenibacillus dendritiformis TaxID=130049 RepID=UPI0018CD195F|nr:MarR family transcriptional regulator [Paenibacillus dendritiformis]